MTSVGTQAASPDIRDQLRRDHELALAELEALRRECDGERCHAMLRDLRQAWKVHTLAEETVVYRALESLEAANDPDSSAGRRFVEHELIEGLFEKMTRARAGTSEWKARLDVARDLIMRHIEAEHEVLLPALAQRFDAARLAEMSRQFEAACAKLTVLEEAKAA
ncbi:MAG: hemerythrin domain-containing protein [Usitatibacter sp.]